MKHSPLHHARYLCESHTLYHQSPTMFYVSTYTKHSHAPVIRSVCRFQGGRLNSEFGPRLRLREIGGHPIVATAHCHRARATSPLKILAHVAGVLTRLAGDMASIQEPALELGMLINVVLDIARSPSYPHAYPSSGILFAIL